MSNPLVSIVVPVYNQERFLPATLKSLREQTYCNLEIIFVDDGSTDMTLSILESCVALDKRIRLIRQQHQFAGVARNRGLDEAQGKYIIFLDSDDLFERDMIADMVELAEARGAEMVVCRADLFEKEGDYTPMPWQIKMNLIGKGFDCDSFCLADDLPEGSFQLFIGWAWDRLFLTDYVRRNNFRFGDMKHTEDAVFVFPATIYAKRAALLNMERTYVHYRQSGTQLSASSSMMNAPLSFFSAADLIFASIEKLHLSDKVKKSFYCWSAHYVCWTLRRIYGVARDQFLSVLKANFEPKYGVAVRVAEISRDAAFASLNKMYAEDFRLYSALMDSRFVVEFSKVTPNLRIRKSNQSALKNWLYSKRTDLDNPNRRILTIFGINFSFNK
ncbi:MAG: glycosyltransferase family 2 protein [Akkermansia sp.]|nr:glycosyltransferase family 2 protein [Akkermansia sp.]